MAFYEFTCRCGEVLVQRRPIAAMDDPGPLHCGAPTERRFSPTRHLFIPIAFQNTWSDFHEETERELARQYPNLEPAARARSKPSGKLVAEERRREEVQKAIKEAVQLQDAIASNRGETIDE